MLVTGSCQLAQKCGLLVHLNARNEPCNRCFSFFLLLADFFCLVSFMIFFGVLILTTFCFVYRYLEPAGAISGYFRCSNWRSDICYWSSYFKWRSSNRFHHPLHSIALYSCISWLYLWFLILAQDPVRTSILVGHSRVQPTIAPPYLFITWHGLRE